MKTIHPMGICPECYPCLERLLGLAVELATSDPEGRRQVLESARRRLDQEFGPDAIPAGIANRILPAIYRLSGNRDPFAARKARGDGLGGPDVPARGRRSTATTWNPTSAWPRRAMPWIFSGGKRKRPGRWRPGWSSPSMRRLTCARHWRALPV